jgi:AcrR family transcriptional regulator
LCGILNAVNLLSVVQATDRDQSSMGIAERRERERGQVRELILEAAREILSEEGLGALSMRAIGERIEYSPATIYLYFRDKDELIRAMVEEGFARLGACVEEETRALGAQAASPLQRYGAMGRAYARFALENTAYFRVMFELPADPQLACPSECGPAGAAPTGYEATVETVRQALAAGELEGVDPEQATVIGWGLVHGLTSLYLAGHLRGMVDSNDAFLELIEEGKHLVFGGRKAGAATERSARSVGTGT